MPRSVMDLQLSKSLSKSDSNLVAVSPIQVSLLLDSLKWNHGGNFHLAVSVWLWQIQKPVQPIK